MIMTRKDTERTRTPPGQSFKQDCLYVIDKMGWHNTREAQEVMGLDVWYACIEYGYWA